jgi:hypothetical protein
MDGRWQAAKFGWVCARCIRQRCVPRALTRVNDRTRLLAYTCWRVASLLAIAGEVEQLRLKASWESQMKAMTDGQSNPAVPKGRQRHYSYDESVDKPAKLIEEESVEIEEEVPAEENESIETIEKNNNSGAPIFEE